MGELRFHDVIGFHTLPMKNVGVADDEDEDEDDDAAGLMVMEFMDNIPVPFQQ